MQTARQSRHGDVGESSTATASSTLSKYPLRHGRRQNSGNLSRMAAPSFMANDRRRRKATDGRRPPEMRRHPLRSATDRRRHGARAVIVTETDIEARRTAEAVMNIMRTLDTLDAGGHHGRRTSRPFPFSDGHHGRQSRHGRRRKRWRSGGLFSVAGHRQGQRQKTCRATGRRADGHGMDGTAADPQARR